MSHHSDTPQRGLPPPYEIAVLASTRQQRINDATSGGCSPLTNASPPDNHPRNTDYQKPLLGNGINNDCNGSPQTTSLSTELVSPSIISDGDDKYDRQRHLSGGILIGNKERRPSSPDRRIRFNLEHERPMREPCHVYPCDVSGACISGFELEPSWDSTQNGRKLHDIYYTPSTKMSDQAADSKKYNNIGWSGNNPTLVEGVFEGDRNTNIKENANDVLNRKRPLRALGSVTLGDGDVRTGVNSDVHSNTYQKEVHERNDVGLARRWWEPRSDDIAGDSSQTSTLDSVFTERSWSSERRRPIKFREKRRVYPKPKDPMGDLGDGLRTGNKRRSPNVSSDRVNMIGLGKSNDTRDPMHHAMKHRERSGKGGGKRDHRNETELRKSMIRQELILFMSREKSKQGCEINSAYSSESERELGSRGSTKYLDTNRKAQRNRSDESQWYGKPYNISGQLMHELTVEGRLRSWKKSADRGIVGAQTRISSEFYSSIEPTPKTPEPPNPPPRISTATHGAYSIHTAALERALPKDTQEGYRLGSNMEKETSFEEENGKLQGRRKELVSEDRGGSDAFANIGNVTLSKGITRTKSRRDEHHHRKTTDSREFRNWRFLSILAAVWFCPIGIWAVRKSIQVDSRVAAGDMGGAQRAATSARNHSIAAFIVLALIFIILMGRLVEVSVHPQMTFIQNYDLDNTRPS